MPTLLIVSYPFLLGEELRLDDLEAPEDLELDLEGDALLLELLLGELLLLYDLLGELLLLYDLRGALFLS